MEAVSPANLPKTNKALVLFLAVLQLILFVVYGIFVNPLNIPTLGLFEWLTLITIVASVGYLYINNYQRQFLSNVLGNWLIMWIVCFELYFLFVNMWDTAEIGQTKPVFGVSMIYAANLPLLMLTVAYVNIKGFLKLPEVLILAIVGVIGVSCNNMVVYLALKGYDSTSMTIFLFGSIYGIVVRLIGIPPRKFSTLNKHIPLTKTQAMVSLFFALFFFPVLASQTDTLSSLATANTFMCMVSSLMASLIIHLAQNKKIHYQTLLYCAVAAALIILVTPGLIQNLAAPAIVGFIVGCAYTFLPDALAPLQAAFKVPDPALTIELFAIPAFIGGILSAIFIACYNIQSYNKLPNFPFQNILNHPIKTGGMQLAVLVVNCLLAIGFGLIAGFLIKYTSEMNELEENTLLWSEKELADGPVDGSNEPLLSNEADYPNTSQQPISEEVIEPVPANQRLSNLLNHPNDEQ